MASNSPDVIFVFHRQKDLYSFNRANEVSAICSRLGLTLESRVLNQGRYIAHEVMAEVENGAFVIYDYTHLKNPTQLNKFVSFMGDSGKLICASSYLRKKTNFGVLGETAIYRDSGDFIGMVHKILFDVGALKASKGFGAPLPDLADALDITIEIPEDIPEEEVLAYVNDLSMMIDEQHRDWGGKGVRLSDSEIVTIEEKIPELPHV